MRLVKQFTLLLLIAAFTTTCATPFALPIQEAASTGAPVSDNAATAVASTPTETLPTATEVIESQTVNDGDDRLSQLWSVTVAPYLRDDLWKPRDIYDAGHVLMVPLHVAFQYNRTDWINQFHDHFRRFVAAPEEEVEPGPLSRLHYDYLASRYLCLSVDSGQQSHVPLGLERKIREEIRNLWEIMPAWQWGRPSFEGGMRERILWKLNNHTVERSYYRAIIDEEFFIMAIAADLAHVDSVLGREPDPVLVDVLNIAKVVFQNEVVYGQDGGWIFQPGVWRDHPDYVYAGYTELAPDLVPKPVLNVAPDSSHSHRMPLWLLSLMNACPADDKYRAFYQSLFDGLRTQFFDHVLVPPSSEFPFPRLNNYMDGWNGVYRYNYQTVGDNLGYGPYQLSGILLEGWWIFLGTDEFRSLYAGMSRQFPLRQDAIELYVGPNTTRERHPLVVWPDYFTNGFAELYTFAAGQLKTW